MKKRGKEGTRNRENLREREGEVWNGAERGVGREDRLVVRERKMRWPRIKATCNMLIRKMRQKNYMGED